MEDYYVYYFQLLFLLFGFILNKKGDYMNKLFLRITNSDTNRTEDFNVTDYFMLDKIGLLFPLFSRSKFDSVQNTSLEYSIDRVNWIKL
jgi:hypothetical protein